MGVGHSGDLRINIRNGTAQRLEPGSLLAVPRRGRIVIRENRERRAHDVLQIRVEGGSSPPARKTPKSEGQLVPDRCCDRAPAVMFAEPAEDAPVGYLRNWRRHDTRVEQVAQRHSETLRPEPFSLAAVKKSGSRPTSSSEYRSRNAR